MDERQKDEIWRSSEQGQSSLVKGLLLPNLRSTTASTNRSTTQANEMTGISPNRKTIAYLNCSTPKVDPKDRTLEAEGSIPFSSTERSRNRAAFSFARSAGRRVPLIFSPSFSPGRAIEGFQGSQALGVAGPGRRRAGRRTRGASLVRTGGRARMRRRGA